MHARNYNEPSDGRYCEEEDQLNFCFENRVILQVIDQVFDLRDIKGNDKITLEAGDWHDIEGNLLFPGESFFSATISIIHITYMFTNTVIFITISQYPQACTNAAMNISVTLILMMKPRP